MEMNAEKRSVCAQKHPCSGNSSAENKNEIQTLFIILANIFALYVSPFLLMPLTEVKVLKSASQSFRFKSHIHFICCDTRKSWTRSCVSFSKWNHSLFAWTWFSCFEKKNRHLKGFRCQRRSCCASVDALFRICWSGFFLNQVKAFIAKRLMCSVCVHCTCIAATSAQHAKPSKYYVFLKASSSTIFFRPIYSCPFHSSEFIYVLPAFIIFPSEFIDIRPTNLHQTLHKVNDFSKNLYAAF